MSVYGFVLENEPINHGYKWWSRHDKQITAQSYLDGSCSNYEEQLFGYFAVCLVNTNHIGNATITLKLSNWEHVCVVVYVCVLPVGHWCISMKATLKIRCI